MPENDQDTEKRADPRPFATFLMEHNRGRSHDELSLRLRDLLEAIEATGKAGTITYKVSIKPQGNTEGAVLVTDEITVKTPQLERPASIFFVGDDYQLCRNDPRQLSLENMETDR